MKILFHCLCMHTLLLLCNSTAVGQEKDSIFTLEASVSIGLYIDLFYANINIIGDAYHADPVSYPDKPGKRIQPGKVDRVEFKYHFNPKVFASINFGYAIWKDYMEPLAIP